MLSKIKNAMECIMEALPDLPFVLTVTALIVSTITLIVVTLKGV